MAVLRIWRHACLRGGAMRLTQPGPASSRASPLLVPSTLATQRWILRCHLMTRISRQPGPISRKASTTSCEKVGLQEAYRHSISNSPSRVLGVDFSNIPYPNSMNLYTVIYNYCLSTRTHGKSLFYSFSPRQTTARLTRSLSCSSRRVDRL